MGTSQSQEPKSAADGPLVGKVAIVTGANTGLGLLLSGLLCQEGCHVILACRNGEKGRSAVQKVKEQIPDARATFIQCDLSSPESVRSFVNSFHAESLPLNLLINNAGMTLDFNSKDRVTTSEGFETTMASNHLGHFLMTHLLLDDLKKAAAANGEARIVVITSTLHGGMGKRKKGEPMDVDNLMLEEEGSYNGFQAYKNSKLANVYFTYELSKQLEESGITVNCMCPGFIPNTNFMRNASSATRFMMQNVVGPMLKVSGIVRTPEQGSQDMFNLATSDQYKGISGKYFSSGVEKKSSDESYDEAKQKALWEMSGRLLKMEGYEGSSL